MRKILNYLLGEELVSRQNDKEIKESLCLAAVIIPFAFVIIVLSLIL